MSFCKYDNLAEVARKVNIPYSTLYYWLQTGKISLPRDEELLAQLHRSDKGRYYRTEEINNNFGSDKNEKHNMQ